MRELSRRLLPNSIQRVARSWLHLWKRKRFHKRRVERNYGDVKLSIELVDQKGESWYDSDRPLDPEIEILKQHRLVPGARVFNLGAHQGVVALVLCHLVGDEGTVIAVEAMPFDANAARRNQQLNRARHLTIINAAIAAEGGTIELIDSGRVAFGDTSLPTVRVDSITIDTLAAEYGTPDVLFIDVDGFEYEALKGAANVLQSKPDCYVEVHSELLPRYGTSGKAVLGFFPDDDFDLLVSREMRPSKRTFMPLEPATFPFEQGFHLLALAKKS